MKSFTSNSRKQLHSRPMVMNDKPSVCGILFYMAIKNNIKVSTLRFGTSKAAQQMVGETYGSLYVIKYAGDRFAKSGYKQPIVLAQCNCGHIGTYVANHVKHGRSKSCGCIQAESTRMRQTIHGQKRKGVPRGTRAYSLWRAMIDRCKTAKRYLELGITVCEEWLSFENFYRDMGDPPSNAHTLDRKDNFKGYYKDNCRYATRIEQANNTRRNVWISIGGKQYTLAQAVRELGLGRREVQNISAIQNGKKYHGGRIKQSAT